MPSREEIANRIRLVNSGYGGWVQALDPSVTNYALTHPLFRDRYRAVKFRSAMEAWPGFVKVYTRAGADLDFYRWVSFVEGHNCGNSQDRLYTIALPESNTVSLLVFKNDPSGRFIETISSVT